MNDNRFVFSAVLALGAVLFATIVLLAVVWVKADRAASGNRSDIAQVRTLAAELRVSERSPTHGKDIAYWCNFDVALKADLAAYIGQFHGHAPTLPLPPLDCAAIEAAEAASAKK